ncbi:hypothetical protein E5843_02355 [Luteimonas yindakuii]|uniref:hypothetical protein n=1 Tax=Luteimonas yindakuii TaxID=2565782 RepID=UPI0010A427DF|nr:hypothetical protein [Luteimonas yindakuii]QCO66920.1 hypothetical protein E5843_02355 [Luteimonas yindakuii]
MPASIALTPVADGPVSLAAAFDYEPRSGTVAVRYRVDNTSDVAVAVFDRGNRHAVLTGRQRSGAVGEPTFVEDAPGDVTLRHIALPLPDPAPTLPPTPLAVQLQPGASLEGEFAYAPPTQDAPRRVRWCLGVMPFDATLFDSPEEGEGVTVWQASFDAASQQQQLCTAWFDVSTRRFEAGDG